MGRHLRRLAAVAAALAALALAACGDTTPAADRPDSGIRGHVYVDGGCPVVREGEECPAKRLSAVLLVTRSGEGTPYAEVTSDDDGSYELRLPPGHYIVSGQARDGATLPFLKPREIAVEAHAFLTLDVSFDSGIR